MSRGVSRPHSSPSGTKAVDGVPRVTLPGVTVSRPASVDARRSALGSLDFAILREFSGEGSAVLGHDPRRSPEVIAKRLGVSPATVRRRLTAWRAGGFLRGFDVLPHPGLLGGRWASRIIEFLNPIAQERAIQSLSLIDGVVQIVPARTTLCVVYFVDSESQAERRMKQLQGTEGVKEIGPEMCFEFPPCSRRMSRRDWRLVLALRRNPEASLAELAAQVGQSTSTTSRRFDSLLDEGAMMFDPIFEFSHFSQTLAILVATVGAPGRREEIECQILALHPLSIPSWSPTPPESRGQTSTLSVWVTARTTAEVDELAARVAHIPGVTHVLLWYGRSTWPIRSWLNERIETVLRLSNPAG
jgi:DNA-binding Lrp family transcriptional regulator